MKGTLTEKHCKACEGGVKPLSREEALAWMKEIDPDWELSPDANEIECTYAFKNYYHTMAFVNAIAYMANAENHHPDLEVSYNRCVVEL